MSSLNRLHGRTTECAFLATALARARDGRSQVVLLRGEAGVGKTALLEFAMRAAEGYRVTRTAGVESEMELPFASLHQLCGPFMGRLDRLPDPQRQALATTFGMEQGAPPDRFLVGLAVLTLLSEVAEDQPVLCVVDDAQWLDQASAPILEFVARRLHAERVAIVLAVREGDGQPQFVGLPELVVHGLGSADAAALLDSAVAGPLDGRVRDRILAEAQGHPLALLELARELSSAELTFGPVRSRGRRSTLVTRLEEGFLRQLKALSSPCRQVLLLAAAEPVGDVPLLWRAAERLSLGNDAVAAAETTGLLEVGERVRFRHPLVRSAVYREADGPDRRNVHMALADVTNATLDPDRRAWHRAKATAGADEDVAAELERSADRALARGGLAAAAAFLEEAATLTPDPPRRAKRSLAAAQAKAAAGAFEDALGLLSAAPVASLDEGAAAQAELLTAQISLNAVHGNAALPMLLAAARRLEALDPKRAGETLLDALAAAIFAGRLAAEPGAGMRLVAESVRDLHRPAAPTRSDNLLRHIAAVYTEGYAAAAPALRTTVTEFGSADLTIEEAVRFAWLAACAATDLWDDGNWDVLTKRHLDAVRQIGALSVLPVAINSRVIFLLLSGELAQAEALVAESRWIAEITGGVNTLAPYGDVALKAVRGDAGRAEPEMKKLLDDVAMRGEGVGLNVIGWFQAMLYNSLGRYEQALAAAELGAAAVLELGPPKWALAEVVEAGVRSGRIDAASRALEQLSAFATASGTDAALGIAAARTALMREGDAAENLYLEAIDRLARTTLRVELARAQLLYGEWLRREGRRVDARLQLRAAHDSFTAMGALGFASRAGLELAATGETVRKRTVEAALDLTPQETQIVRLVSEGLTNPEIGAALYLSPRTVEWHLSKVFGKLGVRTRRQLRQSVPVTVAMSSAT